MLTSISNYSATLGESPVWDNRNNLLYYIDVLGHKAISYDIETGHHMTYDVNQPIGSLMLTSKIDEVVVALEKGLYILNTSNGKLKFLVDPEPDMHENRLNDGKVDAKGRIWVGSLHKKDNSVDGYNTTFECNLHRVDEDLNCKVVNDKIILSNGIAWSPDKKYMYHVDSPTRSVYRYNFDLESGTIRNIQTCITLDEDMGMCDGMDIDSDGNLWIAHWNGWCVGKWNPITGRLLDKIEIPVAQVSSCSFGGENYDKLFITTANINISACAKPQPDAGKVFVAENIGSRGFPSSHFRL